MPYLCKRKEKILTLKYHNIMKKLFLLAIPAMLLASCGPKEYTISGKTTGELEGKQVLLLNNAGETLDSCLVADSAFTFAGLIEGQGIYTINADKARASLFVQNGANITADLTAAPAMVSDNGGLNDNYNAIMESISVASKAINEKAQKLMAEGMAYPEVRDSIKGDVDALYDIYRNGVNNNKENIVGAQVLGMVVREFYNDLTKLDSIIAEVKYATEIKAVNDLRAFLEVAEKTKEGKMFVDFSGFDLEGNESKLSDYVGKGKYVLADFWASWCGPCKGEIPNLIELQKQFGGEKFVVLGVNVWDQEEKFKEALKEEGITYPQIYVPRDGKVNATELYGIQGIPQIMLFGPDGTILKRNLRGESMKAFVAEQVK